jgi:hypothetical protein
MDPVLSNRFFSSDRLISSDIFSHFRPHISRSSIFPSDLCRWSPSFDSRRRTLSPLDSISPRPPCYRRRGRRTNWWRTRSRWWSPFVVNQFLSSNVVKSSSSIIHTTKVTSLCHITFNLERIIPVVRSSRQHRLGIHDFLLHPSL